MCICYRDSEPQSTTTRPHQAGLLLRHPTATLSFNPFLQFLNNSWAFLSGAQLFTYQVETSVKLDTYPTLAKAIADTNANSNPTILDSAQTVGLTKQRRKFIRDLIIAIAT